MHSQHIESQNALDHVELEHVELSSELDVLATIACELYGRVRGAVLITFDEAGEACAEVATVLTESSAH